MRTIHILFPVLNEERRLTAGIEQTVQYMEANFPGRYQITIVDNGSTDATETLGKELAQCNQHVAYIRLNEKGVGLALRAGVEANTCDIVGYMDVDLSTRLDHLSDMDRAFDDEHVCIVNGSRLSKGSVVTGRKPSRNITSHGFKWIMKLVLGMKSDDALCGFKFFRKEIIEQLIPLCSNIPGWFFCVELLIRAERAGIHICEIPVVWQDDYDTTVNVPKLIRVYLKEIFHLFVELRMK
jgi:glycosyltransferase involved in cell wall biosynthesis